MSKKALKPATEDPAVHTCELVRRAQAGDATALTALRKGMDASWWEQVGDLAENAQVSLLKAIGAGNGFLQEAVPRRLAALKAELAGPSPTPLERLLVERVAACWLAVQVFENVYAQNMHRLSLAQGEYYQRCLDRAHRRYLSTIRSLAVVRRLLRPVVAQVNIAGQQVNVSAGGSPAALEPPLSAR